MTSTPYTLGWHIGGHPRLWLALKDGERVVVSALTVSRLTEDVAQALAEGKAEPARVPQEIRPEVSAQIRSRSEAVASPAAERLRAVLILWGVMSPTSELEACCAPSPQASEKNE